MDSRVLSLSKDCRIMKRNNRVIIANTQNGEWFKLSEECFCILEDAIKNKLFAKELIQCFEEDQDQVYFERLLEELYRKRLICYDEIPSLKLKNISFNITSRCNLACKHCCVDASTINGQECLSTNEVLKTIDKIIECNPESITISGGEPLVRGDFFEISNYLRNQFKGDITLMTNGVLINETNIKALINAYTSFEISLDGFDEESCSQIRGEGVFGKVIKSIHLLQSYGVDKISLSMVTTNNNFSNTTKFINLNKELGTRHILREFSPIGRGEANSVFITELPSMNDNNKYINNLYIDPSEEIDKSLEEKVIIKNIVPIFSISSCGATRNTISIGADGSLYPCQAFQMENFKMGNIKSINNLKNYVRNKEFLNEDGYKNFENTLPQNAPYCKDCDVNLFCLKCPFRNYLRQKNNDYSECQYFKKSYSKVWEDS